jgi:tRNA A-37 threonylcarbamoyl transferase component Bud32
MTIQNLAGQMLGQYELRELIGAGGMGAVYRGYQANLKREVAVKVLVAQLAQQPGYLERFNREAETAAALEHRHIIPIYDYGTQQGISYVVMRLLSGGTLADRLAQHAEQGKPLPSLGEIANVLEQLASALDYAHSQGVIHRDIKPSNVMFDNQGSAYLVDFGIAKLVEATHALTGTGATMGTPSYMSPEQWRAETLSPATDQYALGVMTYSLVTGKVPFEAPTPYALMHKHLNEIPTPPQVIRPDAPQAVNEVLNRAMAKQPGDRFPTCTAFAQAFESAIRGQSGEMTNFFTGSIPRKPDTLGRVFVPAGTTAPRVMPTPPRPIYRRPPVLAAAGVAVITLAVVLAVLVLGGGDQKAAPPRATTTPVAQATAPQIVILDTPVASPTLSETPADVPLEQATAVPSETPAPTTAPTHTPLPTATATPVPSETPNLAATAEAMLAQRLTQTADAWTDTPTPDIEATVEAAMTGTADAWTDTPTSTPTSTATNTPTFTPTLTPTPTFTPTRTPTFAPLLTATPLPRPSATLRPSQTSVPYLHVGGRAQVYVEDEGLKLRAGPGTNYEILENMPRGTVVTIIGESTRAEGYTWWYLRSPYGRVGWSVEAANNLQTLVPLPD